ncbi:hypothetical protein SMC26_22745 [Actinomadura fulvescens]|uniref:Uncharacterized protein n=1 Tax=Actinomadura fulvescens TaxID=46160 RepID=A0ABP6CYH5_9ACTN
MASVRPTWTRVVWPLLVVVDVLLVAVFAVTAAIDPEHVLNMEGVDIEAFQGLVPFIVVVVLRSMTLLAERRLLPVARGGLVLAGRLAALLGFFYSGRWMYERAYGRWYEVVLGGTIGYALVGVLGIGLATLIYNLSRMRQTERPRNTPPPSDTATRDLRPSASRPAGAPATRRRQLTKDSLFGLVGVFMGVTGLAMGVTNVARIGLAVLVGAASVAGLALLLRTKDDSDEPS